MKTNKSTCNHMCAYHGFKWRSATQSRITKYFDKVQQKDISSVLIWRIILIYLLHSLDTSFSPDHLYRQRNMQKYPFRVFLTQLCRILHSHEH